MEIEEQSVPFRIKVHFSEFHLKSEKYRREESPICSRVNFRTSRNFVLTSSVVNE